MTLHIERLTTDDIHDAWELSTQVGWNQTRADWRRILELFPETCFAGRVDGTLVATSTLATYERQVGWIGMVLVNKKYRRRGYGSEVFEQALNAGIGTDIEIVGLDATDAGRTVYDQYGFERVRGIDRWIGTLGEEFEHNELETVRTIRSIREIASFDRRYSGVGRSALLEHLLDSEGVIGIRCEREGSTSGYAIARPGRTYVQIGPFVASERTDIESLLAVLAKRLGESVVIDVPDHTRSKRLLERFGLEVGRRLHRMTYDEPRSVLDEEGIIGATGFEWG